MKKLIRWVKRAIKGAGYLEGYGEHPGTVVLFIYAFAAGLAGIANGGLHGFLGGAAIGFVCLLPFYIIGCVDRAKSYEQDMEHTAELLKRNYNG